MQLAAFNEGTAYFVSTLRARLFVAFSKCGGCKICV